MLRSTLIAAVLISAAYAADLPEKFAKRVETADVAYQAAVQKADNARYYALQKANADRVKLLKTALADATKSGDFDAATELKLRLTAAESAGFRTKPKNTLKFGNHEYALIDTKASWHVAKRICEEMGGHLATLETPAEQQGVLELCKPVTYPVWIGATDELEEDKWLWVTGKPVEMNFRHDNAYGAEHYLCYWPPSGNWDDNGSARNSFVCEWDN